MSSLPLISDSDSRHAEWLAVKLLRRGSISLAYVIIAGTRSKREYKLQTIRRSKIVGTSSFTGLRFELTSDKINDVNPIRSSAYLADRKTCKLDFRQRLFEQLLSSGIMMLFVLSNYVLKMTR